MQDFTKQVATSSDKANSTLLEQNKQIPKILLSKDRLWNLVFWLGISSGLATGNFFRLNLNMPQLATFIDCSTLICIPLLLILFNRTHFIQNNIFINSEGMEITKKQLPRLVLLPILSGIGFAFLISETILPKHHENIFVSFIFFCCLLSGLSLHFIFKNCPLSILFNYKFWLWKAQHNALNLNSTSISRNSFSTNNRSPAFPKSADYIYNPAYKSSISNIYHKR